MVKNLHANAGDTNKRLVFTPSVGWEDPLEEEIATPSSILTWEILWTEEPGGLQSVEL